MPREKFYQTDNSTIQEDLTIRWADEVLFVQGDILILKGEDPNTLDRMIRSLKRARRALRT